MHIYPVERRGTREGLSRWPSPQTPRGHSLWRASPPRAASDAMRLPFSFFFCFSVEFFHHHSDLLFHVRQSHLPSSAVTTNQPELAYHVEPIDGARSSLQGRRQLVGHRQQVPPLAGSDIPPPRRALWTRHRCCSCTPSLISSQFRFLGFVYFRILDQYPYLPRLSWFRVLQIQHLAYDLFLPNYYIDRHYYHSL